MAMGRLTSLLPLLLIGWFNSSALVDGFITFGCNLAYLPYQTDDCILSLQFRDELPDWMTEENVVNEIHTVEPDVLREFAENQVCPCGPIQFSPSCPKEMGDAVARLKAACPPPTSTVVYG